MLFSNLWGLCKPILRWLREIKLSLYLQFSNMSVINWPVINHQCKMANLDFLGGGDEKQAFWGIKYSLDNNDCWTTCQVEANQCSKWLRNWKALDLGDYATVLPVVKVVYWTMSTVVCTWHIFLLCIHHVSVDKGDRNTNKSYTFK